MGYAPVFVEIDWEQRDAALADGTVDCIWNCYSMTGREDLYLWAGPYLQSRQMVMVLESSEIQTLSDLTGRRVAVMSASKPEELLLHPEENGMPDAAEVYCFEQMDLAAAAVRKGYADAAAGHEYALRHYASESSVPLRLLEEPLMTVELGVAFPLDGDADLVRRLTQTLDEMRADGTVAAAAAQYGLDGSEITGG